jgi:methyltransferase-like protein
LKSKGLRYLGEADLNVMVPSHFPAEVAAVLQSLSADLLHLEQYMDFLRNRMFRQTLLVHADKEPCYHLSPESLEKFHVASPLRPTSAKPNLQSLDFEQFDSPNGMSVSSRDPIVKATLMVLGEVWPQTMPFPKARALARSRLKNSTVQDATAIAYDTRQVGQAFLQFYTSSATGLVELHVRPLRLANRPAEHPVARPLIRWQASEGTWATNARCTKWSTLETSKGTFSVGSMVNTIGRD